MSASSIAEWLHQLDPAGGLDGYLAALEENCDLQQLRAHYIDDEAGHARLKSEFFEDFGVVDPQHQVLFSKGISGSGFTPAPRLRQPAQPTVSERMALGMMGQIHANAETVSEVLRAERGAAKPPPASAEGQVTATSFQDWLRQVDSSGSLDVYLAVLEENFDLADMLELWHDQRFFEEVGVTDTRHQQFFARYFQTGTSKHPPDTHETHPAQPAKRAKDDASVMPVVKDSSSFAQWLRDVDPTGGLDGYLPVLQEHCDFPLADGLYIETDGCKRFLTERFFDDLGIVNEQHQKRFADYYKRV